MDLEKLCQRVMNSDDVKEIPVIYVYKIIFTIIDAISSGECFYDTEID